jgi:glycosyltransferase involved in cell wall biosynthesis
MKVLVTAVGHRTEHWTDLFGVLCRRPDVELTVAVADVSAQTSQTMRRYVAQWPRLRYHLLPHLLSENRTGHMASVLFHPGACRVLAADTPDVIHVIGEAAYLSTWQMIRWRAHHWPDVPLTLYAAQNVVMRFPAPFPRLERRAYNATDHAFPITPAALNVLRSKGYRGPATIVPLGVDTTLFTPATGAAQHRFTVGFVGRLEPHKGVLDLLDAVRQLDCDLSVVGRGSLSPAVAQEAARRPGRITVRDWADHDALPGLLAGMNVLVLPSAEVIQRNVLPWIGIALREQFGRVLVEAMACGVPVIGSDVGEIPHVIGPAGMTFPAGDVAALVDRIDRLRNDPALSRRLGRAGVRRAIAKFGWDRAAATMCETWQRLAQAAPRGRPPHPAGAVATTDRPIAGRVTTS